MGGFPKPLAATKYFLSGDNLETTRLLSCEARHSKQAQWQSTLVLSLVSSSFFIRPPLLSDHPNLLIFRPDEPLKFSSDLKPMRVTERQTAVFEVRLSKKTDAPFTWKCKGKDLKRDEKFDMSVSEDGLTYTLRVKDVRPSDTGDYTLCLGDLTATAPLFIESKQLSFLPLAVHFIIYFREKMHNFVE